MPSISEAPNGGAKPFGSFSAFGKGTRRKGETLSRRYRSNGYVRDQKRHIGWKAAFASRLTPTKEHLVYLRLDRYCGLFA